MGPMSHCSVLQPQPTEPAVVSSPGWLQAQTPGFPYSSRGLRLSPFLSVFLPSWGRASCSSLPLLCPFQMKPLNLSPFVSLAYIWLVDGEPREGRGGVTSLRHPLSTYYCWKYRVDSTQSLFS